MAFGDDFGFACPKTEIQPASTQNVEEDSMNFLKQAEFERLIVN